MLNVLNDLVIKIIINQISVCFIGSFLQYFFFFSGSLLPSRCEEQSKPKPKQKGFYKIQIDILDGV